MLFLFMAMKIQLHIICKRRWEQFLHFPLNCSGISLPGPLVGLGRSVVGGMGVCGAGAASPRKPGSPRWPGIGSTGSPGSPRRPGGAGAPRGGPTSPPWPGLLPGSPLPDGAAVPLGVWSRGPFSWLRSPFSLKISICSYHIHGGQAVGDMAYTN